MRRKTFALLLAMALIAPTTVVFGINIYQHYDSCKQQVCTRITSEIAYLKTMQFHAENSDDHITDMANGGTHPPLYPSEMEGYPAYIRRLPVLSTREDIYAFHIWQCGSVYQFRYNLEIARVPKRYVKLAGLPADLEEDTGTDCLPDTGGALQPSALFVIAAPSHS